MVIIVLIVSLSSGTLKNKESACISIPPQLIQKDDGLYHWRTNLYRTRSFWPGWFTGMSDLFVNTPVPKVLIIADTDRLDTPLTIAQMQGKYQLAIFPQVGHLIQEDSPSKTVSTIFNFMERFRL